MSDTPILGTHGEPPEEHDDPVDGVVLFDPTPRAPLDPPDPAREPRRVLGSILLLLVAAVATGGYWLYLSGSSQATDGGDPPIVLPPIMNGGNASAPALTPLGRGDFGGVAGSSVMLEVRATGSGGVSLSDSLVRFRVIEGAGLLQSDTSRTDRNGTARAELLLPRTAGLLVVTAELTGSDLQARIPVSARAGPPQSLVARGGEGQGAEIGELLPERLAVIVADGSGNPVPGTEVRFDVLSGGGQVAPLRARTDSLGQASALWRLGPESGLQRLEASAFGVASPVTFSSNARGRRIGVDGRPTSVEAGPVTVARRDFVVGGSHVCALVGGTAACRGANDRGQRGGSGGASFAAIAGGISHMCGLDPSGTALCWGANEGGQLGDGSRTDRPSPVPVRTELRFSSLTAGASHTCGLAGGGVPVCWGQNLSGQLGDGSRTDARFPRAVGGGLSFGSLVAGWSHTCGLTSNGNAFCWGLNSDGQLGDGSRLDRLVPTLVRGAIESMTAGSAHTCGVSRGEVLCWGDNRFGQLGDGSAEGRAQPVPVVELPAAPTQVAAGAVHTCAIVADGSAYCWGQNLHGQLGDGSTQNRNAATAVAGGLRFRSIYAGGALTCGFATDGSQYCWGLNQAEELGDGTRESRSSPTRVQG